MNDGTRKENVVPLTTEYQNMLKSEFENKTGITIDYIIIHPYTGETIDIESSITINSGDTPSQKIAAKAGTWEQGMSYIIGTLTGDNFEVITNGNNSCVVDENGVIIGYSGPPSSYPDSVKSILQSVGINAATITEKVVSWEVGSTIPSWSEYTKYS